MLTAIWRRQIFLANNCVELNVGNKRHMTTNTILVIVSNSNLLPNVVQNFCNVVIAKSLELYATVIFVCLNVITWYCDTHGFLSWIVMINEPYCLQSGYFTEITLSLATHYNKFNVCFCSLLVLIKLVQLAIYKLSMLM